MDGWKIEKRLNGSGFDRHGGVVGGAGFKHSQITSINAAYVTGHTCNSSNLTYSHHHHHQQQQSNAQKKVKKQVLKHLAKPFIYFR